MSFTVDLMIVQFPPNSESQWFKKVKWETTKAKNRNFITTHLFPRQYFLLFLIVSALNL